MTRNLGMMAGLLILAACGEKEGSPLQQASNTPEAAGALGRQERVKTTGALSFGVITATCITTPTSEVKMILDNVFGGLDSNGKIARNIKQGSKEVPQIDSDKLTLQSWPTDLDFDASTLGTGPVKITIVISTGKNAKKPGLHFLRPRSGKLPTGPDPSGLDSSLTVLVPDPTNDFCGRLPIDVDTVNNTESVSFVMNRVVGSRSLNLGLLVPGAKTGSETQVWLPLFLDPNVRNQG